MYFSDPRRDRPHWLFALCSVFKVRWSDTRPETLVPSLRLLRRCRAQPVFDVRGGVDVSINLLSRRNRRTYHFRPRLTTLLDEEDARRDVR